MARPKKDKMVSSSSDDIALNDNRDTGLEDNIKFICEGYNEKVFVLPKLRDGKNVYKTDKHGNVNYNVTEVDTFSFTKMIVGRNENGVLDNEKKRCFFIVSRNVHGADFDRILAYLRKQCKNPKNFLYTEDDYFKLRNPEAFRIAAEKKALIDENEALKLRAKELEEQLGFKQE